MKSNMLAGFARAAAVAMFVVAIVPAAQADEVSETISAAQELYEAGELADAVRELQFAVGQISKQLGQVYMETLPAAPDGWTADEPESAAGAGLAFGGGQMITREYREASGRGRMEAQLIVDSPMMQAMAMMFANPAMASQMGYERVRVPGRREEAMLKWEPNESSGEIVMVIAGRILIRIDGSGLTAPDVLKSIIKSWDIKALKSIAGI